MISDTAAYEAGRGGRTKSSAVQDVLAVRGISTKFEKRQL